MAKLHSSYVPKDFKLYIPAGMKKVIDIQPGNVIDWYFGTDIDGIKLVNNEGKRQQVIILHVRDA